MSEQNKLHVKIEELGELNLSIRDAKKELLQLMLSQALTVTDDSSKQHWAKEECANMIKDVERIYMENTERINKLLIIYKYMLENRDQSSANNFTVDDLIKACKVTLDDTRSKFAALRFAQQYIDEVAQ